MKETNKKFISLLLAFAMVFTSMSFAFAEDGDETQTVASPQSESVIPELSGNGENVKLVAEPDLTGSITAIAASFVWNAVTTVENVKYAIRIWEETDTYTDSAKVLYQDAITATSFKTGNILTDKTDYKYQIVAYDSTQDIDWNGITVEEIQINADVNPGTVDSISAPAPADNLITISWTKGEGLASKYEIVRDGNSFKPEYNRDASPVNPTNNYSYHSIGGAHNYAVRTFSVKHPGVYVDSAAVKSANIGSYINVLNTGKVQWRVRIKKKTTLYKKGKGSKKYGKVAKNTYGYAIGWYPKKVKNFYSPKRAQIRFDDGRVGWVQWSKIAWTAMVSPDWCLDFPISIKKDFVNGYGSSTNYLVWISRYTQRVNVFQKSSSGWQLTKSYAVSTGKFYKPVSSGVKSITKKKARVNKVYKDGRRYYFRYGTYFQGSGYFHTICWWTKSGKARNSIKHHKPNTLGCVRMPTDGAKYVYGLPKGTTVLGM